ncbi:MAG TPA: hypothetical protein VE779_05420 [Candidatus Angelobacter sp.]|nr:hypothetical protein [Candidatus Angelobacter sp.]
MKKILFLLLLVPALAGAQSPFDGTWKVDMSQAKLPKKPDELLLKDGMYECKTCKPEIKVKSDGQMQKIAVNPYADMYMVTVVDPKTVQKASSKDGKDVTKVTMTVSDDGNTLTTAWTYYGNPTGGPVSGTDTQTRVGKAPAGSHAISGSWRDTKSDVATADALIFSFKSGGDSLSYSTPTGQSYTAPLDGKDAPYVGDPGTTSVSLKRMGDSIEETDKRDGKVISVAKMTVSPDGKTMTIAVDDKLHGTTATYVAVKQ